MESIFLKAVSEDDLPEVCKIISDVSEGYVPKLLSIGNVPPEELLESAFIPSMGVFNPNNLVWILVDGRKAGLLFAYKTEEKKLPLAVRTFLGPQRAKILEPILQTDIPNSYWINTFWVAEEFRGEGISQVLMDCARQFAKDASCQNMSLHCWTDNVRALRFYAKEGFITLKELSSPEILKKLHPNGAKILVCPLGGQDG